jgi:hypothetical protein
MKKCNNCGEPCNYLYCSKDCRNIGRINKANSRNGKIKCTYCNIEFQPYLAKQTYCSIKCREISKAIRLNAVKDTEFNIFKRDNFTCIYCGNSSIENNVKLNIDHLLPRSKGGQDVIDNLITSCSNCNKSKGNNILPDKVIYRIQTIIKQRNGLILEDQLSGIMCEIDRIKIKHSRYK